MQFPLIGGAKQKIGIDRAKRGMLLVCKGKKMELEENNKNRKL